MDQTEADECVHKIEVYICWLKRNLVLRYGRSQVIFEDMIPVHEPLQEGFAVQNEHKQFWYIATQADWVVSVVRQNFQDPIINCLLSNAHMLFVVYESFKEVLNQYACPMLILSKVEILEYSSDPTWTNLKFIIKFNVALTALISLIIFSLAHISLWPF